jgi:hypothetical protein
MIAGPQVQDLVVEHLNGIGNVMNLEWNAQTTHDNIEWAIQADRVDNEVWLRVILNYFILPDSDIYLQEACRRGYSWPRHHPPEPWRSDIIWQGKCG